MKIPIIMVLLLSVNLQLNTQVTKHFNIPVGTPIISNTTTRHTYPMNMKRNNPFNIRTNSANKWVGKIPDNKEPFEKFETLEYGIRAGMKLLQNYSTKYGINTVKDIIHKFAPTIENDTDNYIKVVCSITGFKPCDKLDLTDKVTIIKLAEAMIYVEQGVWINPVASAYNKYIK